MKLLDCLVTYNIKVKPEYHILGLKCDEMELVKPGQFITISVDKHEHILRRPFTIYRVIEEKRTIEIFFKTVGIGTKFLSESRENSILSVLGPLGNGFPLYERVTAVLLSRGVGLAALALLGEKLKKLGNKVITIASFRDKSTDLVSYNEYVRSYSDKVFVLYDENGTSELDNVKHLIRNIEPDVIYTAGSKRLAKLLQTLPYEAYVSWEERMGCGIGACRSCVVKTLTGYKLTCSDGPVFNVKDLIL